MANEIKTSLSATVRLNGETITFSATNSLDMTGGDLVNSTQIIGTSSEVLNFGDITGAPGMVIIKNIDDTNFVEIGGDSGLTVFKIKLLPGEYTIIRPSASTVYAKADTASVSILLLATEV